MSTPHLETLLVELCTEELPPKALSQLGQAFGQGLQKILSEQHLLGPESELTVYATPRRLAARLSQVRQQAEDQGFTDKLMPVHIGLDAQGAITPALAKRLQAKGMGHMQAGDLTIESDGKQDYLFAKGVAPGAHLANALQEALDYTLTHLPIPKVMRYQLADGVSSVRFVRPAHGLVALWGGELISVHALGLQSGRQTFGHRFMGQARFEIHDANSYEAQLHDQGKVIASFDERRALILQQLQEQAQALNVTIGDEPEVFALLDEVTALVEHPTVYVGQFEAQFLDVPSECLILTMRLNQKYFPLFEQQTGKLTNHFLIVSNMHLANPVNIIEGNQRVVRPRLADAQFFFETDRKTPLADRVASLGTSVYHNKLGSQLDRIARLRTITRYLAEHLGGKPDIAERAAMLAKADLNSNMVGEFPELQGIMGAYYAQADHEAPELVLALREQYRHRLEQPVQSETLTLATLFLAERVEVLLGIWGVGLAPTGERDPYALRRAALGIISAYEQLGQGHYLTHANNEALLLENLLAFGLTCFEPGTLQENTLSEVLGFIYERYRNQLINEYDRHVVEAVLALHPPLHEVQARIQACARFALRPEAASLASANKRVSNLLRKNTEQIVALQPALLLEPAEQQLAQCIEQLQPIAEQQYQDGKFDACLETLAQARGPVDQFFNDVMVMADDPAIRANRLALLARLHNLMNQVADISRLAQ